jgi:hypothetical protein
MTASSSSSSSSSSSLSSSSDNQGQSGLHQIDIKHAQENNCILKNPIITYFPKELASLVAQYIGPQGACPRLWAASFSALHPRWSTKSSVSTRDTLNKSYIITVNNDCVCGWDTYRAQLVVAFLSPTLYQTLAKEEKGLITHEEKNNQAVSDQAFIVKWNRSIKSVDSMRYAKDGDVIARFLLSPFFHNPAINDDTNLPNNFERVNKKVIIDDSAWKKYKFDTLTIQQILFLSMLESVGNSNNVKTFERQTGIGQDESAMIYASFSPELQDLIHEVYGFSPKGNKSWVCSIQ